MFGSYVLQGAPHYMWISCSDPEEPMARFGSAATDRLGVLCPECPELLCPDPTPFALTRGLMEGLRVASGVREGVKDGERAGDVKLDS
jgi:hypothetical protein